jgi:transposase InsO family protein
MKDSLWSMDLFRCESATLRTHWVLVVMDQYTRRIIGFGVHAGKVDGVALCRMFNCAGHRWLPKYLSSDNDPLYRFHQWQANLRILEVTEIKSIPYIPLSHPFVERLIGTLRREYSANEIIPWLRSYCSRFRKSDRFTATKSVQEGRGISLSRRDLPVISALVAIRQGHLYLIRPLRGECRRARCSVILLRPNQKESVH